MKKKIKKKNVFNIISYIMLYINKIIYNCINFIYYKLVCSNKIIFLLFFKFRINFSNIL